MSIVEVAPDLWRWTARHPDWHPADAFGAEVASYALVADDELLLLDPLLPDDGDGAVLERLDALAAAATATQHPHHHRLPRPLSQAAATATGPTSTAPRASPAGSPTPSPSPS